MEPKIIFSTPIYSTPEFPRIPYCLQLIYSIKHQLKSHQYLHVIVNDGSTDKAKNVLDNYSRSDPNLVVVHHHHVCSTYAFNLGIDISVNPVKYKHLVKKTDYEKLIKFNSSLISFIGVDDLVGPGLSLRLKKISGYSDQTKLFLGHYRSFLGDLPYSRREYTPYSAKLKEMFRLLFYVENFPSHTIIWRKQFIKEIKSSRRFDLGIIDPDILSPQAWDLMLYATKYSIQKKYKCGFLDGNTGYKRYGIPGTMTEINKKSNRYLQEREIVFKRYIAFAKNNGIVDLKCRPPLNTKYFNRPAVINTKSLDHYLSSVINNKLYPGN